ncbi:thiamine-phosphate kinase [Rickettsiales bacterium]|nr:thiamine-phosphate kinase [Rickettsiales bacterium]MDB2550310.1 thiamine-phosphate kinase [Rickettsiales bacterium]
MKEFDIIEKHFKKLAINSQLSCDLGDDTANIILPDNQKLVISKDIMAQDTHFRREYGGHKIAYKLLSSNLSDLAASGAKPHSFMLGFTKNDTIDDQFIISFCNALRDLSEKYNISLIGGDTISSKSQLFFSITVFGTIAKNKKLSRNNAKNGDLIFMSGNIGDSYIGLQILENKIKITDQKIKDYFLSKHFYPNAQIDLGQKLSEYNLANSAIDISDGLFADLQHICNNSQLMANIFIDKIAISSHAKDLNLNIMDLCQAGEDYELIFTAKKENKQKIQKLSQDLNLKITEIGFLEQNLDSKIKLFDHNNKEVKIKKYGYEH